MNNNIMSVLIFWGIWVILPVAIDGGLAFIYTMTILLAKLRAKSIKTIERVYRKDLPFVSIIIPTYNEEQNISTCLSFLKIQSYPHDKIEIIVVDNGSADNTGKIVMAHQGEGDAELEAYGDAEPVSGAAINGKINVHNDTYDTSDFKGSIHLITRYEQGKANALNAGIKKSKGDIIINIDSRTYLDPNAVWEMVKAFITRKNLGAAVGNIEINWNLIYEHDPAKGFALNEKGYLVQKSLPLKETFLAKAQFLEYLSSFHIGRYFQDITDSMYTMSGAFSAVRRDVLDKTTLYQDKTVVEDTHLTLDLGATRTHIGYVAKAKAYLKPVTSWERLYAQRIRWHRGQIEVMGLYYPKLGKKKFGWGRFFFFPLSLAVDHTFAFPRLIWFFILPCLVFFGYHAKVILIANLLMYGFYVGLDLAIITCCYILTDRITHGQIRASFYWIPFLAIYRLMLFFIRVSGYLVVLRDAPEWTISNNPVGTIKKRREQGSALWQKYRLAHIVRKTSHIMGFIEPTAKKGEHEI